MEKLTLRKVSKRRKDLIRYRLWDTPQADIIDAWCNQFTSEDDQMVAMVALDALIVRPEESAVSSLWYMRCSAIPDIIGVEIFPSDSYGAIPYDIFRNRKYANKLKIQRLERPSSNPGSGQSSDSIIRYLRRRISSNEKYFEAPNSDTEHVLLVDEFSGSGNQAKDAINDWKEHLGDGPLISAFFMAIHQDAIDLLARDHSDVKVYASEILGKESSLKNHIKNSFNLSSLEEAEEKIKIFTRNNFRNERNISLLGYKKMSLCFKPPYTACNNMAGLYLLKTKDTNVRLFERGV